MGKTKQGKQRSSGWGLSSSDEDPINSSDELHEQIGLFLNSIKNNVTDHQTEEPQPSMSDGRMGRYNQNRCEMMGGGRRLTPPAPSMEQRVDGLLREAENKRVTINDVPGEISQTFHFNNSPAGQPCYSRELVDVQNRFVHSAMVDEEYLIVAAHLDDSIIKRICEGEFVDFTKLLPRDRVLQEQDNRVQIVALQNGQLSCAQAGGGEIGAISLFQKWEQAFRVFSNVYTRKFPQIAYELIQYNHVIHTAALTYAWSNVYSYDIDFQLHMARHPMRSWSVILQQAWNLRLSDRHRYEQTSERKSSKRRDICWRFNQGRCTYRDRCKFDHRCGICGKHGHGAHACRRGSDKRDYDRNDRSGSTGSSAHDKKRGQGGHGNAKGTDVVTKF